MDLQEKIKTLEEENLKLKEHLKKYTAPSRSHTFYENHKEEIKKKVKEYETPEKRKEYNKRYYLKKKEQKLTDEK